MNLRDAIKAARDMGLDVKDQGAHVGDVRVTLPLPTIRRIWPHKTGAWMLEKAEALAGYVPREEPAEVMGFARDLQAWADTTEKRLRGSR